MFNQFLQKQFYKLGFHIGTHPKTFVILPLILTVLCSIGFFQFKFNGDFVYLFSSQGGPIVKEESLMQKYFKQNEYGEFDPSRKSRVGHLLR